MNLLGRWQLPTEFFFFSLPDGNIWLLKSVNKIFPSRVSETQKHKGFQEVSSHENLPTPK